MKYIVKAWDIGYYTTTITSKSFSDIDSAIAYALDCNRNKSQVLEQFTANSSIVVREFKNWLVGQKYSINKVESIRKMPAGLNIGR